MVTVSGNSNPTYPTNPTNPTNPTTINSGELTDKNLKQSSECRTKIIIIIITNEERQTSEQYVKIQGLLSSQASVG